jgi:hypothetical protein
VTYPPRATNVYPAKGRAVAKRWSQEEIRAARQTPLRPLLGRRGYRLDDAGEGNFALAGSPLGIVIKENYWTSPLTGQSGNAIDFLVKIEGLRFEDAMKLLLAAGQM